MTLSRFIAVSSALLPLAFMIVRTVAEGVTEENFQREVDSLLNLWKKINRKKTFVRKAPALLQRETSLTRGIIRDLFSWKVDALQVDSKELHHEIEQYLQQVDPDLMQRVHMVEARGELQLAELDDAAPAELEMVLAEFDDPVETTGSLDDPDLEGLDISQMDSALRSWEES